jgi:hypothetical protein
VKNVRFERSFGILSSYGTTRRSRKGCLSATAKRVSAEVADPAVRIGRERSDIQSLTLNSLSQGVTFMDPCVRSPYHA